MQGEDGEVERSGQEGAEDWENWERAVILNQGKSFKKEAVSALRAAELLGMMRMEKCPWNPESISDPSKIHLRGFLGGLQWIEICLPHILANHFACYLSRKISELL